MINQTNQRSEFQLQEFALSAAECMDCVATATAAQRRYQGCDIPDFLDNLGSYSTRLPTRLVKFMEGVRRDDKTVAAVIRNGWHPELDQVRTPNNWRHARDAKAGNVQNFLLAMYGDLLGEVFSWYGQQEGSLVHDLVPTYEDREEQLGSGSQSALLWHSEDAFHPCRADFVLLYSMRAKKDAKSTLSWLAEEILPVETIATLMEDKYEFQPDTSYSDYAAFENRPVALLYGPRNSPYLRADSVYYNMPSGERERQALSELYAAIDAALIEIEMSSGDTLVLNNRRVVHGRSKFQAQYDGDDRWVKRINIATSLQGSRPYRCCPASRIVHLGTQHGHTRGPLSCDRLLLQRG